MHEQWVEPNLGSVAVFKTTAKESPSEISNPFLIKSALGEERANSSSVCGEPSVATRLVPSWSYIASKWDRIKYTNKPPLLPPLSRMIWKVSVQGISNPIQLERDLDNTRGKNHKQIEIKNRRKKSYAKTNRVHPWFEQYSEGLYELIWSSCTKKNGSFRGFFHSSILKINFRQYLIFEFCATLSSQVKNYELLCFKHRRKFGFGNGVEFYCVFIQETWSNSQYWLLFATYKIPLLL